MTANPVIFTNKARCRDCYRCLRACPVKAIRMQNGQAFVEDQRCIACGTCIRECPQQAKDFRNDLAQAQRLLGSGAKVAVSLAPAFAAIFADWRQRRLPSALRQLGFSFIAETAVGAYYVARQLAEMVAAAPDQAHIGSACPAAVRYIERYRQDVHGQLTPLVSPMIAHAKLLKHSLGAATKVVFIGPCVAKKMEAERHEHAGIVDCVLTFAELQQWLQQAEIDLATLEDSVFDQIPGGDARYYPLVGGSLRTAGLATDVLTQDIMTVSGPEQVDQALTDLEQRPGSVILEPLFCSQGCINGPACAAESNVFQRRRNIIAYAAQRAGGASAPAPPPEPMPAPMLHWQLPPLPLRHQEPIVSEDRIRQILEQTGKARVEDQLNCGACGYPSCRDKAVAVLHGMAEAEMCIPHMRRLAEQRTDRIIETSPNGIVICDQHLRIIHMNPAFRRFFRCTPAVCGKPIASLMDPAPFEAACERDTDAPLEITVAHTSYGLTCHQILYRLREENQLVGIFVNVTRSSADQAALQRLRGQAAMQAQELLEHQIEMAQKLAEFLGKSTAKGERLVENLIRLTAAESAPDARPR